MIYLSFDIIISYCYIKKNYIGTYLLFYFIFMIIKLAFVYFKYNYYLILRICFVHFGKSEEYIYRGFDKYSSNR